MSYKYFIYFQPDAPFFDTIKTLTMKMIDAGLIQRVLPNMFKDFDEQKPEDIGPQVLTMDHLGIGFLACLVPMVSACITLVFEKILAFILEKLEEQKIRRLKKQRQRFLKKSLIDLRSERRLNRSKTTKSYRF